MQAETKQSTAGAQNMDQAKAKMLDDIKAAAASFGSQRHAEENAAYQKLIVDVARNVADAAKEGGFMGIGGVQGERRRKTGDDGHSIRGRRYGVISLRHAYPRRLHRIAVKGGAFGFSLLVDLDISAV